MTPVRARKAMRGLWLENGMLALRDDLPRPDRRPGEAMIRVLQAGICNTDLELVRGYLPFAGIPGHEFVGIVDEGPEALVGERVVGEINISCGSCSACLRGHKAHCELRRVLGLRGHPGAFAEYLTLPVDNLHLVPEAMSNDAATFVEPLAAALEIQEQVGVRPEDRVIVVGDGKLGRLIAQTLALTGCQLLVVGRRPRPSDPLQAVGVSTALAENVEGGGFDIAVECTGNPDGFAIARHALRPRGVLVMKSTYAGELTLDPSSLVVDEITVIGCRCGPFDRALELLVDRMIRVEPLIETHQPLQQAAAAFDLAGQPGILKVILDVAENEPGRC